MGLLEILPLSMSWSFFEIYTDHRLLLTLLSATSTPPPASVERWLLDLQQFHYIVKHIPSKENSADALS